MHMIIISNIEAKILINKVMQKFEKKNKLKKKANKIQNK